MVGALQSTLNSVVKTGKMLIEKSDPSDASIINEKISELRAVWDQICSLSVER